MEWVSGNVFIRDNAGPHGEVHEVGWRMVGDVHGFDHTSYFISGRYRVTVYAAIVDHEGAPVIGESGKPIYFIVAQTEKSAGSWMLIRRDRKHTFECIEGPGRMHCIYSHRDPQTKEIVQDYAGYRDGTW